MRVKFVLLCRFNQAVDHRAGLSTCRSVGKEPVPSGAEASALIYTMVEMARANGVNVYQYLTYLLEKCPTSQTSDEELEKLAPWDPEVKRITGERSEALQAE